MAAINFSGLIIDIIDPIVRSLQLAFVEIPRVSELGRDRFGVPLFILEFISVRKLI